MKFFSCFYSLLCMITLCACQNPNRMVLNSLQNDNETSFFNNTQNTNVSSHENRISLETTLQNNNTTKIFNEELKKQQNVYKQECSAKNGDSCVKLAILYQTQENAHNEIIKELYAKALQYYQKDCEKKEMRACSGLGTLYESGDGIKQNKQKSKKLYEYACLHKDSRGCLNLALMIKGCLTCHNTNKEKTRESLQYFKQACEYGSANSCYILSQVYFKSKDILERNQAYLAQQYLQKACAMQSFQECSN